jgi:hypothetical protein
MLNEVLTSHPQLLIEIFRGSIISGREHIGQEREGKSPATILGTIDAAIKVVGHQKGLFQGEGAFSIDNWSIEKLVEVILNYKQDIIELSGKNTTSKNFPHRAAYILWLIDNCEPIKDKQTFAFVELGSSGGLIIDALKNPHAFQTWMQNKGYRDDFAQKFSSDERNDVIGVDLVIPSIDWLKALILTDLARAEVTEFIGLFERSQVIEGDATKISESSQVIQFLNQNSDKTPFIFSTSMFYQLTPAQRNLVMISARKMLKKLGGGYILISDFGVNRGFQNIHGNVAWIEDERGRVLSPKINITSQDGSKWELI